MIIQIIPLFKQADQSDRIGPKPPPPPVTPENGDIVTKQPSLPPKTKTLPEPDYEVIEFSNQQYSNAPLRPNSASSGSKTPGKTFYFFFKVTYLFLFFKFDFLIFFQTTNSSVLYAVRVIPGLLVTNVPSKYFVPLVMTCFTSIPNVKIIKER